MANETIATIVGNLTADPELRFTPNGVAVANFTVASTPRTFHRQSGEWRDGDALFLRCTAWRDPAEHIAESLTRGDRVVVQGRLGNAHSRPATATSAPWSNSTSTTSGRPCVTPPSRSPRHTEPAPTPPAAGPTSPRSDTRSAARARHPTYREATP
jgi:single-stranded DNA-binding protein